MKKIAIFISIMLLLSCAKKVPTVDWQKDVPFAEILESAVVKLTMIDFIKDG